jgi:hypothetical protein
MSVGANKGLILDFNDEFGEFNVKSIALDHLGVYMAHPKPDVRRIRPYLLSGGKWVPMSTNDKLTMLEKVLKPGGFRGGCLLIDDPNKYMDDYDMPKDLTGMLAGNAHSDLDMILHYQSIGRILPKVLQNTNIFRFHCQFDPVRKSASKLSESLEVFQIAELLVNEQYYNQNNKRFFVYVDKDSGKIIGNFDHAMFDTALTEYLHQNDSELKPFLRQKTMQGKPLFQWPEAMAAAKKKLFTKYWGNNEASDETRESRVMVATGKKRVGKSHETGRYLFEDYCGLPFLKKVA